MGRVSKLITLVAIILLGGVLLVPQSSHQISLLGRHYSSTSENTYFRHKPELVKGVFLNPFSKSELTQKEAIQKWAYFRVPPGQEKNGDTVLEVPILGGRAAIDEDNTLLKGIGVNPEWVGDKNHIKYGPLDDKKFDGKFTLRESLIDMYNSHFLKSVGVRVSGPEGILELRGNAKTPNAIYARRFLMHTRLADLEAMSTEEILKNIDEARKVLSKLWNKKETISRADYFFMLTHILAINAGRMQAAGFQHGVLHNQQVTLAGELADLGTGYWIHDPKFNKWSKKTPYHYFKFEYQPLILQNMLVRTHAITPEVPAPLKANSDTLIKQKKSLLGIFKQVDPKTALEIELRDPVGYFWKLFEHTYNFFDQESFQKRFKPSSFFAYAQDGYRQYYPKKYLGLEEPPMPDLREVRTKKIKRLNPRNYFVDETVKKHLLSTKFERINKGMAEVPVNADGKIVGIDDEVKSIALIPYKDAKKSTWYIGSSSVSDDIWNLNIDPDTDKVLGRYLREFNKNIKDIKTRHGSLRKPMAIQEVLYALTSYSRLEYGPWLKDEAKRKLYEKFVKKRYGDGNISLGEIIKSCVGECYDSVLLGTILGHVVENHDKNFKFRIVKTYQPHKDVTHYFIAATAPNRRIYVIDGINYQANSVGLWSEYLIAGSPIDRGMHRDIVNIFDSKNYGRTLKGAKQKNLWNPSKLSKFLKLLK